MASFVSVQTGNLEESDTDLSNDEEVGQAGVDKNSLNENENSRNEDEARPAGLANVMAAILGKKKIPNKAVILAKGKTDREIAFKRRQKEQAEGSTDSKKVKLEDDEPLTETEQQKLKEQRLQKKEWKDMARVKPRALDKEVERKLQRIATRGVVQLFNAVRKQQKDIDEKLSQVGSSIRKREKVMKSVSKGAFLDMLKGTNANVSIDAENEVKTGISERVQIDDDSAPKWSILREDFMMGASMKNWDKVSDDDEGAQQEGDDPDDDNLESSDEET